MARRYGRNQKRRHREQLIELQHRLIETQHALGMARDALFRARLVSVAPGGRRGVGVAGAERGQRDRDGDAIS